MKRRKRIRGTQIKVLLTPIRTSPKEYEQAWLGALTIIHQLARKLDSTMTKPNAGLGKIRRGKGL